MKFWPLALLMISSLTWAKDKDPYKLLIVADEDAVKRAQEFKSYLTSKVPPFNKMKPEDLEIEIRTLSSSTLKCSDNTVKDSRGKNLHKSALAECDSLQVANMQAKAEAHMAMIFTSKADGGSGGNIPVASTSYPLPTMLHEMLHTYGCADEYEYDKRDSARLCTDELLKTQANIAVFEEKPPYNSDQKARRTHVFDVPWMGDISSSTPIISGSSLGTPAISDLTKVKKGKQTLGLYRGGYCNEKSSSWRPYENSIMRGHEDDTIYPLYEKVITKNIESKLGRKLELVDCPPPGNVLPNVPDINNLMKKLLK